MVAPNPPTADVRPAELIPLADVAPIVPREVEGKKVHRCTIYRWADRGVRGVRLRTTCRDGVRCTCEAWIRQFYRDRGWGEVVLRVPGVTVRPAPAGSLLHASRELARVDRRLEAAGL